MASSLARWLAALPDGVILRQVFFALLVVSGTMIFLDLRQQMEAQGIDPFGAPSTAPVKMDRPTHDNQIRPYLPAARPVAPDETSKRLGTRPHEESEAAPMTFRLGTHGDAFAEGTITPGTADALAEFLATAHPGDVTEIVLHSPGGSVTDATAMAHTIRDSGLNTRILADGYCASSCPLVFAGGVKRFADVTSWIGGAPGIRADHGLRLAGRWNGASAGRQRRCAGPLEKLRRRPAGVDSGDGDAEGKTVSLHARRARRAETRDAGRRKAATARQVVRNLPMDCLRHLRISSLAAVVVFFGFYPAGAAPAYRVLGQPSLAGTTLSSRCTQANARFNFRNDGDPMYGPAGIAIDPRGRIFVTDYGGRRVLTWPNFEALQSCAVADGIIGAGDLAGPESVAVDPQSGAVFVADTLSHTVKGYRKSGAAWQKFVTLGTQDVAGSSASRFDFPRGLAVDPGGRLFVADDFNNRVLIFDPPFTNGKESSDSIGASSNGGFDGPKALAMSGDTLFVADYSKHRVLRFTGPFKTPSQVYVASGAFTGVGAPVDLAVHPDGSLLVTDQQNKRIARYGDAVWTTASAPTSTFADNMGPEPLGVAADRAGRIYVADYRRFRVLIRDEFVKQTPVTAGGTAAARTLLAEFNARAGRSTNRVAIGQQLISYLYGTKANPNAWNGDWLQLENGGFPLPEIMSAETSDLMSYANFAPNQDALNELIRHGKAGHIVELVWHPDHPSNQNLFGTPISTANLRNLINDSTSVGRAWQTQLNRAAAVLQKFQAQGVTVLFRPLHEQNGDFFWWGDDGSTGAARRARQAAWTAVWRDMVTELTVRKSLKNLLFIFGTNQVNYGGVVPPLTYYPGAAWADMVGIDVYDDELDLAGGQRGLRHYAALIGTGKPFGLPEFGQTDDEENGTGPGGSAWDARTLATRIRDSYPRTVFAIAWYSSVDAGVSHVLALPDVSFTKQLLNDALIDTQ